MASYGKSKPKGSSERVALLDDYESDDDDFFLNGPSTASDKVKRVQNQVNEVVGVMQTNIGKVMDRGERLEDLQDKSESLADSATNFNIRATKLRKQMWWKSFRMKVFLVIVILFIILIIVLSVTLNNKGS
ncbi:vesicle-associated membrane protein 4-like [Clavelina lepadiformis]|uniref:vesicle-associated membrane protein 4-like n=1 Tax=Clavelina lepadiformis TaxID=159417 RepID=UPI00404279BA